MIKRYTGETISVRTIVKEDGAVKVITGGTAKARLKGRSSLTTIDATIALTGASGIIDADFAAPTVADKYDFECVLTLSDEVQVVSTETFNVVQSVYA